MTAFVVSPRQIKATRYDWRLVLVLWLMSTLAALLVVPYLLAITAPALSNIPSTGPVPLEAVVAFATVVQYSLLGFISAALGQLLARRIGLGAPAIEALLGGERVGASLKSIVPLSVIVGVTGGISVGLLDLLVFAPLLRMELGESFLQSITPTLKVNPLFGLLASFQGGIFEELLLRYFLFSLLAWLGSFIQRTPERRPTLAVLWTANILTALLFGLGHLPATAQAGLPLSSLVVTRALVLNGLLGLAYAYLYWTRGLEAAMLAHFSSDVILHFALAFLT